MEDETEPPVLYIEKRTIQHAEAPTPISAKGALLLYVEGFTPTIARGSTDYRPYWEPGTGFVPYLEVSGTTMCVFVPGTEVPEHWLFAFQKVRPAATQDDMDNYANPNNTPGYLTEWRMFEDGRHVAGTTLKPEDTELFQGDSMFIVDATVNLHVDGAQAATVWLVGLGEPPAAAMAAPRSVDMLDPELKEKLNQIRYAYGTIFDALPKDPPVMYLVRRPVRSGSEFANLDTGDEEGSPSFLFQNRLCKGVNLFFVENFEPLGWPDEDESALSLSVKCDLELTSIAWYRMPGSPSNAWVEIKPDDGPVTLQKGGVLLTVNATVTLEVSDSAKIAQVRIAGFGSGRSPACNSRPC
jgi:hypothetical protein